MLESGIRFTNCNFTPKGYTFQMKFVRLINKLLKPGFHQLAIILPAHSISAFFVSPFDFGISN